MRNSTKGWKGVAWGLFAALPAMACLGAEGPRPGLVEACWDGTQTVWKVIGFADIEQGRPAAKDDLFWAASNSKGVAASLVLTFVDEGKIGLDDPVEKYFPEWKDIRIGPERLVPKTKPTVRMVLSHQSGLGFFPGMPIDRLSVRELVTQAVKDGLQSEPGERWRYSNWGIDIAVAIAEQVGGKPWEILLQERILDPLGMKDTCFWPTAEQMARLEVPYYTGKDGTEKPVRVGTVTQFREPYGDRTRHAEAGGGLFSTVPDMLAFAQMVARRGLALDGRRILSERICEEWYRSQTPPSQAGRKKKGGYSFGMEVVPDEGKIAHGGAYGTYLEANWKQGTCRVTFIQRCRGLPNSNAAKDVRPASAAASDPAASDASARLQAIVDAAADLRCSAIVEIPAGVYDLTRPLLVTNDVSLSLHPQAVLRAAADMDCLVVWSGRWNRALEKNPRRQNRFLAGGQLDGAGRASCLRLTNCWHLTVRDMTLLNGRSFGLRVQCGNEVFGNNLTFRTCLPGLGGNTALRVEASDCHFTDVVSVDYTTGVYADWGSGRYTRCHVWNGKLSATPASDGVAPLASSVGFHVRGSGTILRDCYADSARIGYLIDSWESRLLGCSFFNNRKLTPMDDITVVKMTQPKGRLLVSGGSFVKSAKRMKMFEGEGKVVWRDCLYSGWDKTDDCPGNAFADGTAERLGLE